MAWAADGAPSDCVALAVCGFLERRSTWWSRGINPYANLGHDVTYSGTVTAAMEAAIWGIPAIAMSLNSPDNHGGAGGLRPRRRGAGQMAEAALRYGLGRTCC